MFHQHQFQCWPYTSYEHLRLLLLMFYPCHACHEASLEMLLLEHSPVSIPLALPSVLCFSSGS